MDKRKIAKDIYVLEHREVKRILDEIKKIDEVIMEQRKHIRPEALKNVREIVKTNIGELIKRKKELRKELTKAKAEARKEFTKVSKLPGGSLAPKPVLKRVVRMEQPGAILAPKVRLIRGEKIHSKLPKLKPMGEHIDYIPSYPIPASSNLSPIEKEKFQKLGEKIRKKEKEFEIVETEIGKSPLKVSKRGRPPKQTGPGRPRLSKAKRLSKY